MMPHSPFNSQGSQFGENHRKQECWLSAGYLLSARTDISPTFFKTNKQTNLLLKPTNKTQPTKQKQTQTPKDN